MHGRKDGIGGASAPHRFVEPRDPRTGLAVAGVQPGLQQAPSLAVADASLRPAVCALPGCGRPRDHAIHEVDG